MGLTYLGGKTLGACLPVAISLEADLEAAINGQLPSLNAELAGILAAQVEVFPPSITIILTPPGINLGLLASISVEIGIQLGMLNAAFAAAAQIKALFLSGGAGIHAYAYAGPTSGFGSSLATATGGGLPGGTASQTCYAIVLATMVPEIRIALEAVFGVSLAVS